LPVAEVWKIYTQTSLKKIWRSSLIEYGFATFPGNASPIDMNAQAEWPGLQKGSRFYMDILGDYVGIFCRMAMGIEITNVEPEKRIDFAYLDLSPAYGEQSISFEATGPETTQVTHRTRYLGKDAVINYFYLTYHRDAISKLHAAALQVAENYKK
jgi:hypothetical protein